jgi:hypothetical protein
MDVGLCEPEPEECHLYPLKTTRHGQDRAFLQLIEENEVVIASRNYRQRRLRQGFGFDFIIYLIFHCLLP